MTREEFRIVVELLRPDITRAQFARMWHEFERRKSWGML